MVKRLFTHGRPFCGAGIFFLLLILLAMVCGCATPVGVIKVSETAVYDQINECALNSGSYSSYTAVVLRRHGLKQEDYDKAPELFIRKLHGIAARDDRRDLLFALSELCFLTAQREKNPRLKPSFADNPGNHDPLSPILPESADEPVDQKKYYLGSAVYAFLFLLGEGVEPQPDAFDRRFRLACDLYNRSLTNVMTFVHGKMDFVDKTLPLPVGSMNMNAKTLSMPWNTSELQTVIPADTYEVYGLSVRNRIPGIGAPILAVHKKSPGMPLSSSVPATVFLEVKGKLKDFENEGCYGGVSILSTSSETSVTVNGRQVPLETDLTAPIAYTFNDPILWSLGRNLFRLGRSEFKPGIYKIQPYEPGLIPVVLVHGTMSSPVWWSEMLNTLRSDPRIRKRFQIWLYLYDSGKPVVFSAVHLRESIENTVKEFDPNGKDPALKNIVVVGHSQGGLLTRYTAVETGDELVKTYAGKPLDELDLNPAQRELSIKYGVFHPLPEVRRLVFICTPHRGSLLIGSMARRFASKLIRLPGQILEIADKLPLIGKTKMDKPWTSIDSMSPDNPVLKTLSELPFPPNVKAHSIIAVKGKGNVEDGNDGVVAYKSAHLTGVESELVVPYGHSCQMEPQVIEEVRRILVEHLAETDAANEKATIQNSKPVDK